MVGLGILHCAQDDFGYLQVRVAVARIWETPLVEVPRAVIVTADLVVPTQVARPLVASWAELILTLVGSETVQAGVSFVESAGTAQPEEFAGAS